MGRRAELNLYVTSVVSGGATGSLTSALAAENNWQTAIDANEADWLSTVATPQSDTPVTATGWKVWVLSVPSLPLATGQVWMKIRDLLEGYQHTRNFSFASQNHATPSLRPYIRVWDEAGGTARTLRGIGP